MPNPITTQIMRDESRRLQVYDDATGKSIVAGSHVIGNPTIGYGTLLSAPGGITDDEVEAILDARIAPDALQCLAPATYTTIVNRERSYKTWGLELEATIKANNLKVRGH